MRLQVRLLLDYADERSGFATGKLLLLKRVWVYDGMMCMRAKIGAKLGPSPASDISERLTAEDWPSSLTLLQIFHICMTFEVDADQHCTS